jgi:hypothetical protein
MRSATYPVNRPNSDGRRCLFCLGPLPNGAPVCSEACDEGWWSIVPTKNGELFTGRASALPSQGQ